MLADHLVIPWATTPEPGHQQTRSLYISRHGIDPVFPDYHGPCVWKVNDSYCTLGITYRQHQLRALASQWLVSSPTHLSLWQLSLRWRHNDHNGVSNHQPHHCLLNCLFGRRSKKTSKLRGTGLCAGNSPGTGEFPAQMASNAENICIIWRHHDYSSA